MIGAGGYEVRRRIVTADSRQTLCEIEHDLHCARGLCRCDFRALSFVKKYFEDNALNPRRPELEVIDALTGAVLSTTCRNVRKAPVDGGRHWIKTTLPREAIATVRRIAKERGTQVVRIVDAALRAQHRHAGALPAGVRTKYAIQSELRFNVEQRSFEANVSMDAMVATFILGYLEHLGVRVAAHEPDPSRPPQSETRLVAAPIAHGAAA